MTESLFTARPLCLAGPAGETALKRAFALVSLARPGFDLRQWTALLSRYRRRSPRRAGLVALHDPRGYAHAVFRYAVDTEPPLLGAAAAARRLRICDLVLAHSPGRGLEEALSRSAEELARDLGCHAVLLELPLETLGLGGLARLRALGFEEARTTVLARGVTPARDALRCCAGHAMVLAAQPS